MAQSTIAPEKKSSNLQIVAGEIALDGTNPTPIVTGLSTIVAVGLSLKKAATPSADTTHLSYGVSGGTVNAYAWQAADLADSTLIASTFTETIGYVIAGY